jgi:hypothetical protein
MANGEAGLGAAKFLLRMQAPQSDAQPAALLA